METWFYIHCKTELLLHSGSESQLIRSVCLSQVCWWMETHCGEQIFGLYTLCPACLVPTCTEKDHWFKSANNTFNHVVLLHEMRDALAIREVSFTLSGLLFNGDSVSETSVYVYISCFVSQTQYILYEWFSITSFVWSFQTCLAYFSTLFPFTGKLKVPIKWWLKRLTSSFHYISTPAWFNWRMLAVIPRKQWLMNYYTQLLFIRCHICVFRATRTVWVAPHIDERRQTTLWAVCLIEVFQV